MTQIINRFLNLVNLNCRVNKQSQVGDADTDNLNGVLQAKGVPNEQQFVQETKNEERQESGNRFVLRSGVRICRVDLGGQVSLKLRKDVTEIMGRASQLDISDNTEVEATIEESRTPQRPDILLLVLMQQP